MKVGRSDVGSAAAASHTASLTGSDAVFDAVLREYDVHRAHSIDELFDVAYAASFGRFPQKAALGVITVSRSDEHTSEIQSLMRPSYTVFCSKQQMPHRYNLNSK